MNGDGQETRFCPFKTQTEKSYDDNSGLTTTRERFEHCAGDRCMAYCQDIPKAKGRCLLVEKAPF